MEAVADHVGGTFLEGKMTGGYGVEVAHGVWTLTLDLHVVSTGTVNTMHTRVVCAFASRTDFRLRIRRRTFLDRMAAKLGIGNASYGDGDLARGHVVRGRPTSRVRSVLSGGLSSAILAWPSVSVVVSRAPRLHRKLLGPQARQLQVLSPGVDTEVERPVAMITVARAAMDALARSGVAT